MGSVAKIAYRSLTALVGVVTAIIIIALCNAYLGGAYLIWWMIMFGIYGDSRWTQFWAIGGFLSWFFYYAWHGSVASGEFWTLRVIWSPAGMSSCTRNAYAQPPYNPNGLSDYTDASYVDSHVDYCPYPEVRWADSTDVPFTGTDENDVLDPNPQPCVLCNMASQRPVDYAKNKGRGLSHNWFYGASPLDTMLCPGVDRTINSAGLIGKGRPICAHCSRHFDPTGSCDPPVNDMLCALWCPNPSPTVASDMRRTAEVMLSFSVIVAVYAAVTGAMGFYANLQPYPYAEVVDPETPTAHNHEATAPGKKPTIAPGRAGTRRSSISQVHHLGGGSADPLDGA